MPAPRKTAASNKDADKKDEAKEAPDEVEQTDDPGPTVEPPVTDTAAPEVEIHDFENGYAAKVYVAQGDKYVAPLNADKRVMRRLPSSTASYPALVTSDEHLSEVLDQIKAL